MQFDDDADLDTSEVQDVHGSRIPGGRAAVGGGIGALLALLLGLSGSEGRCQWPVQDWAQVIFPAVLR
ncbi:hypothetical protein ACH4TV_41650 [Streptomyces sp. NPDC020898]|uniref:hypothetical protein n=1 Tax=Streptomyces sp. NPDC020898 TaxID=3365101 RepID=UPI0037BC1DC3